jgi:PAS domain S-box-containing protein
MILTLAVVATEYFWALEDQAIATMGEQLATLAASVADDIDALVLARSRAIEALARQVARDGPTQTQLLPLLRAERQGRPDIQLVAVVDPNGKLVAATDPARVGASATDRAWFAAARDHREARVFGPHYNELASDELAVGLTAPITGRDGQFLGVVREELSLAALLYKVRQRVRVISDDSVRSPSLEWILLDQDGLIIAESDLGEQGHVNLRSRGVPSAQVTAKTAVPGRWLREEHGRFDAQMVTGYADVGQSPHAGLLPWRVLIRMQERDVVSPMRTLLMRLVGGGAMILLPLFVLLARLVAQRRRAERALRRAHGLLSERIAARTGELSDAIGALEAEIRERRRTEDALRRSEERWRTLSELTSDWACAYRREPDGRIVLEWASDAFTRVTGFTVEDVQGLGWLSFVHPDDRAAVSERTRARADGEQVEGASRIVTRAGEVRWIRDRGTRIHRDPGGDAVVVYAAGEDITERKQAEEILRESEAELADFFDNAQVGLHCAGPDGTIVRANRAELELLGYAHDEYVGRHIREFHVDAAVADDFMRELACGGTIRAREARLRCKDGSVRNVLIDANVLWRNGRFIHTRCFTRDVTEQHRSKELLEVGRTRAEEQARELANQALELEHARNEALGAARAKSAFLANMSHEIRTPITAILGYAELLAGTRPSPPLRQEYVETIRRNGEHLLGLINDVLDLSKLEAGKMMVEDLVCSPARLGREVEVMLGGRAAGKGLGFDVVVGIGVPAAIRSDPRRIRQVLVNLVGNAIKFTESGSVQLAIECDRIDADGRAAMRFVVSDTGVGMTSEEQARIFEPFIQAEVSTTRRFGGTGLGLAISQRIAEALGGTLELASEPGRGSTFTLSIEVDVAPAGTEAVSAAPVLAEGNGERPPRLRGRVLLAEDAPDSQRLLAFFLRKAGAEVDVVENGRKAVERVQEVADVGEPYDLVLMDMLMPIMDGYEATAALRRLGIRIPIIALTAYSMDGDRARCLEAGCTDYLAKPVDRLTLLRRLREHLDGPRRPLAVRPEAGLQAIPTIEDPDPELRELLATFVAGLSERAEAIETSLVRGDLARLAALAHQLKGTARAYGFPQLTDEAASLEASLRAGVCLEEVRMQVQCVVDLCRAARCQ